MAIVIEEEHRRNGTSILTILLWLVFLIGLAVGAYYIFFKQPQLVEITLPADLKNAQEIAKLELHPEEILSNSQFKSLRSYVTIPVIPQTGRSNPFLPLK